MDREHGAPQAYGVYAHRPDLADPDAYWSWWCACGIDGVEYGTREGAEDGLDSHLLGVFHLQDDEEEGEEVA